jgi:hypothetical protein
LSSRRVWWLIRAGTGWQSSTTESCYTVALSIVWKCWYFIYLYWISVLYKLFSDFSLESSKDQLLLVQCYYRRKSKLNYLYLYWI